MTTIAAPAVDVCTVDRDRPRKFGEKPQLHCLHCVRIIISDPDRYKNDFDSYIVRYMVDHDLVDSLRIMLSCDDVDPTGHDQDALWDAIRFEKVECVRLLLAHPKTDPTMRESNLFHWAVLTGRVDIVQPFLDHPKVSWPKSRSSIWSDPAENGDVDVLRLLMEDGRFGVKGSDDADLVFFCAILSESCECLRLLLDDSRMQCASDKELLKNVTRRGSQEMMTMVRDYLNANS